MTHKPENPPCGEKTCTVCNSHKPTNIQDPVAEKVEEFRAKAIAMQEHYSLPTTPDYYDDELCDWLISTLTQLVKEVQAVEKEWYLGKKIKAFGGKYIIVGISQMVYDEDCEGEPEWKMTKEIQEVAIAEEFDGEYSFQKPSWHTIKTLQDK